jgi:glutathione peroxidase
MHNELGPKGFELLAFPCNQFFNQESGTPAEIIEFVRSRFGSKFTLFEKVEVNGPNTHPVYRFLRNNSELYDKKTKEAKVIPWNFSKFLLN